MVDHDFKVVDYSVKNSTAKLWSTTCSVGSLVSVTPIGNCRSIVENLDKRLEIALYLIQNISLKWEAWEEEVWPYTLIARQLRLGRAPGRGQRGCSSTLWSPSWGWGSMRSHTGSSTWRGSFCSPRYPSICQCLSLNFAHASINLKRRQILGSDAKRIHLREKVHFFRERFTNRSFLQQDGKKCTCFP